MEKESVRFYDANLSASITEEGRKVIEDLAWKIFKDDLKISFRRPLTDEEKEEIINSGRSYNHFRIKAIKIYEKRLKAAQNKKYPVIDVPADGKSGMWGGAFCLCFVYSKHKGNVVLKGYMREVEKYLEKNFTHYFCNFSLWSCGRNRDIWRFWKDKSVTIFEPIRGRGMRNRPKFEVVKYDKDKDYGDEGYELARLQFKRLPKRWIPEFDQL